MQQKLIMIAEAASRLGWSTATLRRRTDDGSVKAAAVLEPLGYRLYDEDYIRALKATLDERAA